MSHLIRVCATLISSISLANVFFHNQAGLTVQSSRTLLVQDKSEEGLTEKGELPGQLREGGRAPQVPSGSFSLDKRRETEALQQLSLQVTGWKR